MKRKLIYVCSPYSGNIEYNTLEMLKATPEEIWDMAMWAIYNRCGYCDYYMEENNND